mmetsp:Transcript_6710/g.12730  ORF Transcript_6710/g.12730 Transcript_6710/m.12730 type:complete len:125 (-) Transcript_6710:766-1140(-)
MVRMGAKMARMLRPGVFITESCTGAPPPLGCKSCWWKGARRWHKWTHYHEASRTVSSGGEATLTKRATENMYQDKIHPTGPENTPTMQYAKFHNMVFVVDESFVPVQQNSDNSVGVVQYCCTRM